MSRILAKFDSDAEIPYNYFIALLTPCSSGFVDAGGVIFLPAITPSPPRGQTDTACVDIVERSQSLTPPVAKQGADIPDGVHRTYGSSAAHGLVENILLHAKQIPVFMHPACHHLHLRRSWRTPEHFLPGTANASRARTRD